MRYEVKDIYEYCRDNNLKMLSSLTSDFWEVYRENFEYFDRLFSRSYKSFMAFSLTECEDIEEAVTEWIYDVLAFLKANEKRYSELWRLQTVSDTDYDILNNYNVTENHNTDIDTTITDEYQAKVDTRDKTFEYGAVSQSDSNSRTYGAKSESDSESISYGEDRVVTDTDSVNGTQTNTYENKVSADNVSEYSPKDYKTDNLGQRTDTIDSTETRASHTDTKTGTHTEQARVDSDSSTHTENARQDTIHDVDESGAHTDTHTTDSTNQKTVTRVGNIGVFSASKLLSEHNELWMAFNFYKTIFDEIANELLRIVYF